MFTHMTLGAKIGFGFATLLGIALVLGVVSSWNMHSVEAESHMLSEEYVPEVQIANNVERYALEASLAVRSYGFTFDQKYLDLSREHIVSLKKHIDECKELAGHATHLVKLKSAVGPLEANAVAFENLVSETAKIEKEIEKCRATLDTDAKLFMDASNAFLHAQEEHMKKDIREDVSDAKKMERLHKIHLITMVIEDGDQCRMLVWKSQALRDLNLYAEADPIFARIDKHFEEARAITRLEVDLKAIDQALKAAHHYKSAMSELRAKYVAMQETGTKRAAAGQALIAAAREISLAGIKHTSEIADTASASLAAATKFNIVGLIVATILSIVIGWRITRGITQALQTIIVGLRGSSSLVDEASGQVAQSSQQMAAGASQQASSLEETSASLEEMASVTRQNAENATQASTLSADAKSTAERGHDAMNRMSGAIQQIKTSSDQTAKIIKTIDEIAFQTNLLALNAAVEAARAGDAGKGFAVVAEEVRNLAMRSAEAAKNTSALIEQSQKNSDNGVQASDEVASFLKQIVESVQKLAILNGEVSTACQEQSRGIDQINTAVSEVDKVTQSNAANAEESAAAAEELSAQSRELTEMVASLVQMVGGKAGGAESHTTAPAGATTRKPSRRDIQASVAPMKQAMKNQPNATKQTAHKF